MNYILEEGFDFYKELNDGNDVVTNGPETEQQCMISHTKLTYNAIKLPCQHSFNYLPLYKELCLHVKPNSIQCPYCRASHTKLIPFIELPNVVRIINVNHPTSRCMAGPTCSWGMTSTENCVKRAMEYDCGTFCKTHKGYYDALYNQEKEKTMVWTDEMHIMLKAKSVVELRGQLRAQGLKIGGTKKELIQRIFYNK
jgi:hypothetical protein